MEPIEVIRRRLRAQRLTGERWRTPAEAVAHSAAVQAQEHHEAVWSLVERVDGADDASVQAACDRGEILRTHTLRPTWHFVAAEDLRWIQRLTAPRVHQVNGYSYRRDGLDADTLARTDAAIVAALADGEPRVRTELRDALEAAGLPVPGQRLAHAVMHAELEALICSGPRRGRNHTYVLTDGCAPDAPARTREEDVAELVQRYFSSHGPATLRDFGWWSSLTLADARAGVERCGDLLACEPGEDGTAWYSAPGAEPPPSKRSAGAHLLGRYDELVVAHRDPRAVFSVEPPPAGVLDRLILVDGVAVGTWRRSLARSKVTIEAKLFAQIAPGDRKAIAAAAQRFGASVGLKAELELSVQA